MKKIIISILFIFIASAFSNIFGQSTPTPGAPSGVGTPAGAGDKNIGEDLIKLRSVEIERMKREANKSGSAESPAINSKIESKFPEIKEDFEGIQIAETAIIKTYTTDKKIDYALIEISADKITKHTKRLDGNIFAETVKKKEDTAVDKSKETVEIPKGMRDMIVELDNAIGRFISSKLFTNLKVYDAEIASSTRNDLLLIQKLSEQISAEAKKLTLLSGLKNAVNGKHRQTDC